MLYHLQRKRYPFDNFRHQLDYIRVDRNLASSVTRTIVRTGADADRFLVVLNIRMKIFKYKRRERPVRYDLETLN